MLFLDSANLDEIKSFLKTSAVSGVTTNPSLVAKEGKRPFKKFISDVLDAMGMGIDHPFLANIVLPDEPHVSRQLTHLSIEAIGKTPEDLFRSAVEVNDIVLGHGCEVDLFIKIPVSLQNLQVISDLTSVGISVNATACMTAQQAVLAAAAGAQIVSFFYNRIKDGGGDPIAEITTFKRLCSLGDYSAKVICGSIRSPKDVTDSWNAGADYVTASAKIIQQMTEHPQTTKAINQFNEDIEKWLS